MKLTKPIKEQKKPSIKLGELNREVSRPERRKRTRRFRREIY
jgi:hypothetical protein